MKGAQQSEPASELDWPPPDAKFDWPKPTAPGLEVSATICRNCTGDLAAKRGMSVRRRIVLSLALSLGVFGLITWLVRDRASFDGTLRDALIGAAGWGVIQAAVLWAGLGKPPGRRMSQRTRLSLAVVIPVLFLAYVTYVAPEWIPFQQFAEGNAAHAVSCGFVGLLFGALVSGGILLLWRGTDPMTPGLTGALAGLVGGVSGGLAIGVGCPSQEGWHATFSHGLGAIILVGFGWAVGRRLLAP